MSSTARFVLVLAFTASGLAACTIASPTHITVQPTKTTDGTDPKKGDDDDAPKPAGEAAGGDAVTCSADDFTKPDLSKLTACGNGKGHCFDRDKTPMAEEMVACDSGDQVCVPDEILSAGGDTLYACSVQALGGADGACITASLFPTIISQGGDALKQDVCDAGQLCVPCKDPTHNNAPTPFCQKIGVHASACGNAKATTANDAGPTESELCCTTDGVSHGICIDQSAIPADQQSKTIRDTCHNATNKCVPKSLVEGNPVTCDSGIAGKGICMDKCFNKWMSAAGSIGALSTDGCEAHEVCVPCVAAGSGTPGCN
jgi:hypothetical protein